MTRPIRPRGTSRPRARPREIAVAAAHPETIRKRGVVNPLTVQ
jgi:hypothetical protein